MPFTIDVQVAEEQWQAVLPDCESVVWGVCDVALRACNIHNYAPDAHISVLLTHDEEIQALNHQYRDKDKPTNVLSFPSVFLEPDHLDELQQDAEAMAVPILLGDIVVALQTVQREAEEAHIAFADHLAHMVVHSVLHLLGYDHMEDDEAGRMEAREAEILQQFGIANPYNHEDEGVAPTTGGETHYG